MGYGNINYRWEKRTEPLTDQEIITIREQHAQGVTKLQIAQSFRVSYRRIDRVVRQLDQYANLPHLNYA